MKNLRNSNLALAVAITAGILTGCNHHSERANADTEDRDLISMKTDTDIENRSADKSAVFSRTDESSRAEENRFTENQTQRSNVVEDQAVQFGFDSADLTNEAKAYLDRLAEAYRNRGDSLEEITIRGYADATGPEDYNEDLSKRRADSVRNYLQQKGVNADAWEVDGLGEENPIASNESEQGRRENRRVVVEFSGENEGLTSSYSPE